MKFWEWVRMIKRFAEKCRKDNIGASAAQSASDVYIGVFSDYFTDSFFVIV